MKKLWFFLYEVRQKKDYLDFKFPNKKIFNEHLSNLVELVKKFDKEITPPIWSDLFPTAGRREYTLSNEYFKKEFNHHVQQTNEYLKHLDYAVDLALKMRMEFRALQAIANMHFIELPFKKWIVNKAKSKFSDRLSWS